ncbi:hypothetical protein [Halopolyspora algeriensis]|nr:hypothetical protein [Halopolyspora algeriensis]
MAEDDNEERRDASNQSEQQEQSEQDDQSGQEDRPEQQGRWEVYGRGVRTALRNNATAYGFSISITAAYGLVTGSNGTATAWETMAFALGAAVAFVLVGLVFIVRFREGSLGEGGQVETMSGAIDLMSVIAAVAVAFGLSRIPGFFGWPLTALGTVITYLMVGGLDVLLARSAASRTSVGREQ